MKWPPLLTLVLFVFWPTCAQEDWCNGICGRRPLASSHGGSMRVIGGTDVLPGTWPFMVSIQMPTRNGYAHICGGSLISPRWVVTAAHCFIQKGYLEHWKLVIGATELSRPGADAQERNIKNLVEHEQYQNRRKFNDIALMELNEPVNCTDYIQPACLPDDDVDVPQLTQCYVSGWGVTNTSRPSETADIMQEAKVNLIPLDTCNSSAWYSGRIHFNNLCAGYKEGGIDSCQGDSGGPLTCRQARSERFWVVGVTSWGVGCAKAQKPGVYTATKLFLSWIKEKTKDPFLTPTRRPPVTTTTTTTTRRPAWQRPTLPPATPPPAAGSQYGWYNPWSRPPPTSPPLTIPYVQQVQNWPPKTRPPHRPHGQQSWNVGLTWPPRTRPPATTQGYVYGQQSWQGGWTWPPKTRPPAVTQAYGYGQNWQGGATWPRRTRPPVQWNWGKRSGQGDYANNWRPVR